MVAKAESARKGEPKFHITEEMRRLSTPWSVSQVRAEQIQAIILYPGTVILCSPIAMWPWTIIFRAARIDGASPR